MTTVGIVAEFNPFHNGHAYLLKKARESGASHIAVIMSGAAVQRGEPAICSKHERARAAVKCGADLVVELPAPYSCSSAEVFADSSVYALSELGIDAICFGTENDDKAALIQASDAIDKLSQDLLVTSFCAEGLSYPAAICKAAKERYGQAAADLISSPNSTLAVMYISALKKYAPDADIIPIKRNGAAHNGKPIGSFASAAYLRESFENASSIEEFVPDGLMPTLPLYPKAYENILYYNLITASRDTLMSLPEMNETLADRILNVAKNPPYGYSQLLEEIKSKNVTMARIRRCALQLTIGATKADIVPLPHLRVLAFNQRGAEIMSAAKPKIPMLTSLKRLEQSSDRSKRIVEIENRAVRLMQLSTGELENEYTKRIDRG